MGGMNTQFVTLLVLPLSVFFADGPGHIVGPNVMAKSKMLV